jgi:hypothetical protein
MRKRLLVVSCLSIVFFALSNRWEQNLIAEDFHATSNDAEDSDATATFTAHSGLGATVQQNKDRRLPRLRAQRVGRVSATRIPDLKMWTGTPRIISDLEVAVSPNTQWAFNLYRPKSKDLTGLSPTGYLDFRNVGIRPGEGAVGLKWGSREYNAPDRRFIDCDYTDIPKEHGLYVSNSGNTLLERCTFLRVGSQGAQWAHRPCPYQQYFADNAPYQSPPTHIVRDCHFVDCAYRGDRPSFNLTYFSPGTSENPGTLLVEDSSFVCKWDEARIDNANSDNPKIRHSTGAIVVTPSQGNLPLDPAIGQMMKLVTLRNCLFDYTAGDRAIVELRSIDRIVIEECCFIARNHTQNGVNIDRGSSATSILDGTKSQQIVLRNNLAENVLVRLGLGDGTRNANIVTIPLHTPGEEVIYCAVTGKEVSRRKLENGGPTDKGECN